MATWQPFCSFYQSPNWTCTTTDQGEPTYQIWERSIQDGCLAVILFYRSVPKFNMQNYRTRGTYIWN